ncbi:rRNA maturation RNase YbeY [Candidatus Parcubacteria bacterium]|nr:rRNA maturation RNase YbeY [Candidatus Parcubacteria bacterium]
MSEQKLFEILNKTKAKLPRLPFSAIKDKILGPKYELSLVFVGNSTSRKLNFSYRRKNEPTDVLSFSLTPNEGEIFINPHVARTKAKLFDVTPDRYIGHLFIHGCFHLIGMTHGSKMDSAEKKIRKLFNM